MSAIKAYQRTCLSSHLNDQIDHDSFRALVAMEKNQIYPLVMAAYAEERDGWWHEMLYQLEHGMPSNAGTFNKSELYMKSGGRNSRYLRCLVKQIGSFRVAVLRRFDAPFRWPVVLFWCCWIQNHFATLAKQSRWRIAAHQRNLNWTLKIPHNLATIS